MHKTVNILDWNIWFGSFRELKCIYCNCSNDLPSRASSFFCINDQLLFQRIQSLSETALHTGSPQSNARYSILSWVVLLRNRVFATWACAWSGHIWVATVQTCRSFFLRPLAPLSMNCFPAYSSILSWTKHSAWMANCLLVCFCANKPLLQKVLSRYDV